MNKVIATKKELMGLLGYSKWYNQEQEEIKVLLNEPFKDSVFDTEFFRKYVL